MLIADETRRISIELSGETVTVICRVPTGQELSRFLNARFRTTGRNKVETRIYDARAEFFDKIAIDIENAEYKSADGTVKPLSAAVELSHDDKGFWSGKLGVTVTSWRDLIPLNVKSSIIQRFEDTADAEEGTKN